MYFIYSGAGATCCAGRGADHSCSWSPAVKVLQRRPSSGSCHSRLSVQGDSFALPGPRRPPQAAAMVGKGSPRERRRHGRRLRALEDAFHRTVKYALRPLDYEQFQEQFPAFHDALVQDLYSGYTQVLHHTRVNIEADFGELCEEHELRDKLNTLEVMCEEQGIADGDTAEDIRQPALGPTNAIRLGLLRAKQHELESLRRVLAEVEARNGALQGQVAERQRQAQELIAKTEPISAQLDAMHLSSKAWANRMVVEPVG